MLPSYVEIKIKSSKLHPEWNDTFVFLNLDYIKNIVFTKKNKVTHKLGDTIYLNGHQTMITMANTHEVNIDFEYEVNDTSSDAIIYYNDGDELVIDKKYTRRLRAQLQPYNLRART